MKPGTLRHFKHNPSWIRCGRVVIRDFSKRELHQRLYSRGFRRAGSSPSLYKLPPPHNGKAIRIPEENVEPTNRGKFAAMINKARRIKMSEECK